MSHLPLDARAILHYLNELGYRNISGEQLKEFLKGMQPQSEIIKKSKFKTQQQRLQQLPTTPTSRKQSIAAATTPGGAPAPASTEAGATAASTANHDSHRRAGGPSVKVIKCKKPLCHFKFYLDICDHQLTKRIEDQIKLLGGSLEFFLTSSVTHFVTDKPIAAAVNHNNNTTSCPGTPQTPQTPQTPHTPYSLDAFEGSRANNGLASVPSKKPIRNSRADAILNRARRLSTATTSNTPTTTSCHTTRLSTFNQVTAGTATTPLKSRDNVTLPPPYTVWPCENALKFFKKVQHELKDYLVDSPKGSQKTYTVEPISLKGGFIKIEAVKRNYRPYYHLFKKPTCEWPKIELTREDGAFRLSPKKDSTASPKEDIQKGEAAAAAANLLKDLNMTRKSKSRSTQNLKKVQENDLIKSTPNSQKNSACKNQAQQKDSSDKQCGVCEICKIEYDALTIHLKTKDHEYFAKNSQNFIALDTLIHSSADVSKFLDGNRKLELKTELEEMEVDQEELVNNDEVDPLDDEAVEVAAHERSHKSCSFTNKTKEVEPKMCSPTLREKSKRSTKGKHSSEKFKNATTTTIAATTTTLSKSPKIASPTKHTPSLPLLDVRTPAARKKHSGKGSNAALSPPIRAMLPPNSLYKVETHTEIQCTPTKNRIGAGDNNAVVASPSIIVKFKKVRNAQLHLLNGEAESFMFPKKKSDSSDLPTDIDRHTSSDRVHNTASIGTTSPSPSSPLVTPSVSDEENEEDYEQCTKKTLVANGKKAIAKAKRRLQSKGVLNTTPVKFDGSRYSYPKTPTPKATTTTTATKWLDGGGRQSFPKAPIQPDEQLKCTHEKRNSSVAALNSAEIIAETAKIIFPEATRKSSRTATAIVTAATTSSRLLQAAVDAAKNKSKLQASATATARTKCNIKSCKTPKKYQKLDLIKSEEPEKQAEITGGQVSRKIRCNHRQSVVYHLEDRMGESIFHKPKNIHKTGQQTKNCKQDEVVHVVQYEQVDDDEEYDDDATVDNDDENDKDYVQRSKPRPLPKKSLISSPSAPQPPDVQCHRTTPSPLMSFSSREERLARRQSRVIAQIKLELQTDLEREEEEQDMIESPKIEKVPTKSLKLLNKPPPKSPLKSPQKSPLKSPQKSSIKPPVKSSSKASSPLKPSPVKKEPPLVSPSRFFDYTRSDRLNHLRYSFERLPDYDLWYRVYKRQDNCEEKYFEYFGSTKYRKLPYELGPVPFEMTLQDSASTKICCKLCQIKDATKRETECKQKATKRDLFLDLKPAKDMANLNLSLQQDEDNNCSSTSAAATQVEHSKFLNTTSDSTQQYTHKHKKLHLLQRYRQEQEQQEQLQRQQLEEQVQTSNNHRLFNQANIKSEEIAENSLRSREEETHSNASSCPSSTGTYSKSKILHKKLLSKTAMIAHLELPPRKSPREHASTLALVSCLIKQRQDSLSKPNSDTDEPPTTPTEAKEIAAIVANDDEIASALSRLKTPPPQDVQPQKPTQESPLPQPAAVNSPRTRSQAATPVEELRFATEISENVKRMRRGRNKYDYSPPFVARSGSARSSKSRSATNAVAFNLFGGKHTTIAACTASRQQSQTANTLNSRSKGRDAMQTNYGSKTNKLVKQKGRVYHRGGVKTMKNVLPSVRKTGSKKGVLEFEVDSTALDALKKATLEYKDPKLLEWQIDKFLSHMGQGYDFVEDELAKIDTTVSIPSEDQKEDADELRVEVCLNHPPPSPNAVMINTPPATDYFSSDFDLYDLIQQGLLTNPHGGSGHVSANHKKLEKFSIFNTSHMQGYYRKRKYGKSNRTGWPKVPKKKAVTRQQSKQNKIFFLQNGVAKEGVECADNNLIVKEEDKDEVDDTTQDQTRESGVITPPDSEVEMTTGNACAHLDMGEEESMLMDEDDRSLIGLNEDSQTIIEDDEDDDDDDDDEGGEENDVNDDNETIADSIEEDVNRPKGATFDAYVEEEDEDKEREDDDDEELNNTQDAVECKKIVKKSKRSTNKSFHNNDDDEDSCEPQEKRLRCLEEASTLSPLDKSRSNHLNHTMATTSTPTAPFMRALRRTPQLNGSLGSCISPSEKAGDNSDIFTVSSDGLDTDLDLSNPHSQLRNAAVDDDHHHHHHHHHHDHTTNSGLNSSNNTTPKRKFDLSKYAPTNAASCAAEAATAAVKSLAISQFLKKEVRVQCRRLRAPFRRFRYRR